MPANLGPEPLGIARDLVRRGLNESALQAYRVGQNVAWQRWMSIAFGLTSDPDELRELLDVSARSLFEFVDATIAGIAEQIQVERDELTRGTHAERREAVALILDGAPISRQRAEARLGYRLEQSHTAAVVWSDDAESSQLERATEALVRTADAHAPTQRDRERSAPAGCGYRARSHQIVRRLEEVDWTRCPGFASRSDRPPAASRGSAEATSTRSPRSACWPA